MGEQASPTDSTAFVIPTVPFTGPITPTSLEDYMGIGHQAAAAISVNALPFRAYNLIWNEFFRDEDLVIKAPENTGDGPDVSTDYIPRRRMKRHDYFTTCRPWPQKLIMQASPGGYTAGAGLREVAPGRDFFFTQYNNVNVIGAPVTGIGVVDPSSTTAGPTNMKESGGRSSVYSPMYADSTNDIRIRAGGTDGPPDIKVLVNDIRTAMQIQSFQEKNARGGTRYAELVRSHFGVISPDARLQRPEFLGGGRSFFSVHPLAQTSASGITGSTTNLGEQAGVGTVSAYNHGFSQSFTEHGVVLGLMNVRVDLTYQQGINRMFYRRSMFDFYFPSLAHLGEQAVFSKEIYADGSASDDLVFGYQERWSEYKYKPSRTSGFMRSSVPTPLDFWHFGEEFAARPVLDASFLSPNPATVARVLQVSENFGEQILLDTLFEVRMVRAMPMYSIPGVGARL